MKVVIFVCSFAAAALLASAAPAVSEEPVQEDQMVFVSLPEPQYRVRRSQYGVPGPAPYGLPPSPPLYGPPPSPAYVSPCGAAAPLSYLQPAPHPSYGYGGGHSIGYAPHYRTDDFMDTDLLNFPDLDLARSEHTPMARYGYGIPVAPAASSHSAGSGSTGAYSGLGSSAVGVPAFSVFPSANVGGCNVPLLLSCSPSITAGRLIKSYGEAPSAATATSGGSSVVAGGNGYRGVEDQQPLDLHSEHTEDQPTHTKLDSTKNSMHSSNQ